MANLLIGCIPNLASMSRGAFNSIIGDSEASSLLGYANLRTLEPGQLWRTADNSPLRSGFTFASDEAVSYDHVALPGSNIMARSSGRWRVLLDSAAVPGLLSVLVPTSTVSASNVDSASSPDHHLDVDEGLAATPGSDHLTPTIPTGNYSVTFGFDTPGGAALRTGDDYQVIAVWAKAIGAGGRLNIEVLDGGISLDPAARKYIDVTNTTGAWYFLFWDASLLTTASGANVSVQIDASGYGGDTPAPGANHVHVGAVGWLVERTEYSSAVEYDSGWLYLSTSLDEAAGLGYIPGNVRTTPFHQFPSTQQRQYGRILIQDDQSVDWSLVVSGQMPFDRPASQGYVEVGAFVIGNGWSPATNADYGSGFGVRDLSFKGVTHGGKTYGSKRERLRTLEWPLSWLTAAEVYSLIDRLLLRNSILDPVLLSFFPGDATQEAPTTFLATVDSPENALGYPNYDQLSMTIRFLEKK